MILDLHSNELSKKQRLFGRSVSDLRILIEQQLKELCVEKKIEKARYRVIREDLITIGGSFVYIQLCVFLFAIILVPAFLPNRIIQGIKEHAK